MNYQPPQQRTFSVEKTTERRKFRPKPRKWSHQDDLTQAKGKMITLVFNDESYVKSVMIDADNYTIKLENGTYYKHAIRSYEIV